MKTRANHKHAGLLVSVIGMITLVALAIGSGSASAVEYGNPDYLGIVKASPPTGFPVSPAFMDLSSGPASITFSVQASNLTTKHQATPIGFSLHHILTFRGQDVSDGQPGQPGISFPPGNVKLVTEALYGAHQTATLSVPVGGQGTVSFTAVISACGYYEIDFSTPTPPYTYLGVGFTRALGCNAATTTTTSAPTTTVVVLPGTTTSIPATTTTQAQVLGQVVTTVPAAQLPLTGSNSSVLVAAAGLCLLVGGALTAASRGPKRR